MGCRTATCLVPRPEWVVGMSEAQSIRPEAQVSWLALAAGLDELAAAGRLTPCQSDPDPFGSDDRAERREAAKACGWCPLLEVCAAYATEAGETNNVWGGQDRTRHPQTVRRHRREGVAS
ncbi:WhiB family transcriptional regulator [uncultured Nocardioides sp.]|uniref:WhiB family transcriptional regulator n=1 Tax=uncultured Nocardioides sp. TaxID=198441 RepID=UPI003455D6D3